jgi:hypothetical protein
MITVVACLFLVLSTSVAHGQVVMSDYETTFAYRGKDQAPRAQNIELAAALLDGVVIQPGETLSFNKVVGPRNERHGFKKAKVIIHKRLRKDFGGGVCQVASTFHAAALKAGLDVIEVHPHSRASTYIHPSLDATVVWGAQDLKVRNPYPYPIRVKTDTSKRGNLVVTLVGNERPDVFVYFQVSEESDFEIIKLARADWKTGKHKVQEPGTKGYKLYRVRIFRSPDHSYVEEKRYFEYAPSCRIILVGTGKTVN